MKIANIRYIFSVIFFLFLINESYSQVGNWLPRAPFGGTARQYAVGFSINNKGYIGTGLDLSNNYRDDFWEYDPVTNTWAQKATFGGGARILAVGFSIGSKGYIGTGQDFSVSLNDFWEYDPTFNSWTRKTNFGGSARTRAIGFNIGLKGYIGTGQDGSSSYLQDFWEYDPAINIWIKKANFGGGVRREAVGFSIGNKGYIGTGFDGTSYKKDFWQYNPANNVWTAKANIGTAFWLAIGFSIGRKGYVGVGYGATSPLKEFWDYDTLLNKWTKNRDFNGTARFASVAFSIGLKGYLGTGYDINNQRTKDFWEFQPAYIVTAALPFNRLCVSFTKQTQIDIFYTKSIFFSAGNVFTAQISDSSGSFAVPLNIGSKADTVGGVINANIPANMIHGNKYRIRVISSNPPFIGSDNAKNLIINHKPFPQFAIKDSIQCLKGNKFNFTSNSTLTFGNIVLSKWFFGDNDTTSGLAVSHSYFTDGNYVVKLRLLSDSGCTDSVSHIMTVLPMPKASFTVADSIQCLSGNKFAFINNSTIKSGGMTYKWYPGNNDSSAAKDYFYSYLKEGFFRVKLIAKSSKGCKDSVFHQVKVDSASLAKFNMIDSVQCARTLFVFNNTSIGSPIFSWSFGDGTTFTGRNASHVFAKDSVFEVRLVTYTASTQCYDTLIKKVYTEPMPNPDFTVNKFIQNRIGNNFVFTNQSTVKSGNFTSYWDFGDGDTSTKKNPSHVYLKTDSFLVKLIITNDIGCKDSVLKWVWVFNSLLKADYSVQKVCVGDSCLFKNTSTIKYDSLVSYLWDFGTNAIPSNKKDPLYRFAKTGTQTVKMTCFSNLGFKDSVSYSINILPSPALDFVFLPTPPFIKGDVTTLSVKGTFDTILWGGGEQTSGIDVSVTGTYFVRVVDDNGCDSVRSVYVEFLDYPGFDPPNIITPNGDGKNDVWMIEKPERYAPSQLYIYNRWGELVNKPVPNVIEWDGKKNRHLVAPGTYFFTLKGRGFEKIGTITVVY